MTNYPVLITILDKIRYEGQELFPFYNPTGEEQVNQARARAYIHLFLKSNLGILDFSERESLITDGSHDGGIDGYCINSETRTIFFVQSKFRTHAKNYENKPISLEELLQMDTDRILDGETTHENGVPYNAKIIEMQKEIADTADIGRYSYKVILLANVKKIVKSKLLMLTKGLPYEVFDSKKSYSELIFPVITGNFYHYSDITIDINLTNKSNGSKIDYTVKTDLGKCNITVLFTPLDQLGKLMYKYKNAILKYNPRSYLTLKEGTINDEIRKTITDKSTNEFALFNNGITILSDETTINERIGQKDRAKLCLKNPQIINGGQTAYTTGLLYESSISKMPELLDKLSEKEVMTRVITFSLDKEITVEEKLEFIESISEATNKQNPINSADRTANNKWLIDSQKKLFTDFGFLLERKRGEFYDGLRYGYIDKQRIIERATFMRIAFACLHYPAPPSKERQLLTNNKIEYVLSSEKDFQKYFFGCLLYSKSQELLKQKNNIKAFASGIFAIISLYANNHYKEELADKDLKFLAMNILTDLEDVWIPFEDYFLKQYHNKSFFKYEFNFNKKRVSLLTNYQSYFKSTNLQYDMNNFFFNGEEVLKKDNSVKRQKIKTFNGYLESIGLNFRILSEVQPLINSQNWFQRDSVEAISEELTLDIKLVYSAIGTITSKEYGYYFFESEK